MRGTPAPQALIAGRHPHRAAGVGCQPDGRRTERHRCGRPAGGSAGQGAGHDRVDRRAVVRVVAGQAVGELVGAGDPGHDRTRGPQPGDRRTVGPLGGRLGQERRDAGPDRLPGHGEQVLHRDGLAVQDAAAGGAGERVADHPPDRAVEARRGRGDVGDADPPDAAGVPPPDLGLQSVAAARRRRDGHHTGRVRAQRQHPHLDQRPGRRTPTDGAEVVDRGMPDQQATGVAAQGIGGIGEQLVHRREVVCAKGRLVGGEGLQKTGRSVGDHVPKGLDELDQRWVGRGLDRLDQRCVGRRLGELDQRGADGLERRSFAGITHRSPPSGSGHGRP